MAHLSAHRSTYCSRPPDASGQVAYTAGEHAIWAELYARQRQAIAGRACDEFLHGLDLLQLPGDRLPQLPEVSARLRRETGWEVTAVPALIPFSAFFALLAERRFPAATFIRRREHLDYLQEPDIFHELFGHAPLLSNPWFAAFTQRYGELGLAATREERVFLARLYWFTVEFGLIGSRDALNGITTADERPATDGGVGGSGSGNGPAKDGRTHLPAGGDQVSTPALRLYGGGILSSPSETAHALGPAPLRRPFELIEVLRTPYRIDILQPLYYVLDSFRALHELRSVDLFAAIAEARRLGLQAPLFPPKPLAA